MPRRKKMTRKGKGKVSHRKKMTRRGKKLYKSTQGRYYRVGAKKR